MEEEDNWKGPWSPWGGCQKPGSPIWSCSGVMMTFVKCLLCARHCAENCCTMKAACVRAGTMA